MRKIGELTATGNFRLEPIEIRVHPAACNNTKLFTLARSRMRGPVNSGLGCSFSTDAYDNDRTEDDETRPSNSVMPHSTFSPFCSRLLWRFFCCTSGKTSRRFQNSQR